MKNIMILSGAGLSAESGLKTFRDADGLWENHNVMEVCSTEGWEKDREKVTQFYNERRAQLAHVEPNSAHYNLAKLEKEYAGEVWHLTQNVDNLLERAGCKNVIHLHGTLTDLRCEQCNTVFKIGYLAQSEEDICPNCQSKDIRHNVVMFGESAPKYSHIYEAQSLCELFIAIGTSGAVIDIVGIAEAFERSLLINPVQEEHVTMFGSMGRNIDNYFSDFIQENAGDSIVQMNDWIKRYG
jgi:NAD-dependent deacetylase